MLSLFSLKTLSLYPVGFNFYFVSILFFIFVIIVICCVPQFLLLLMQHYSQSQFCYFMLLYSNYYVVTILYRYFGIYHSYSRKMFIYIVSCLWSGQYFHVTHSSGHCHSVNLTYWYLSLTCRCETMLVCRVCVGVVKYLVMLCR